MVGFRIAQARTLLQSFSFQDLFIDELGWFAPTNRRRETVEVDGAAYTLQPIAELSGVIVFEVMAADGLIPDAKTRAAVQKEIAERHYENLLIFLDANRKQSAWYWVKRDGSKRYPRSHFYVSGQTGDLMIGKLSAMFVDMGELDEQGNLPVVEAARRVKDALDVERVTKKFYDEFKLAHTHFLESISGIDDERDRRWYTSVVLNRVMFIYFLQRKGFVNRGDLRYLEQKLDESRKRGENLYYAQFLRLLFFEGFAKPPHQRSAAAGALLGDVRYLNGGLFLPHPIEERWPQIAIPDSAFAELYAVFGRYSWNLNDALGGNDNEISPDVLGYIFEKYINQKAFGAYYTRPEITEYLCEQTIHKTVLDKLAALNQPVPGLPAPPTFESIQDLLFKLDAPSCKLLLLDVLPSVRLLDPACGSGAFLVAALKTMLAIYQGAIGRIPFLKNGALTQWLAGVQKEHPSIDYFVKREIITNNLYGVDIMAEAVEIAQLRLFLALVSSAATVDDLEPLPNIDFNVLPGNSLIGLLRVDEAAFGSHSQPKQNSLFDEVQTGNYRTVVAEKNRLIGSYKAATAYTDDLQALRDNILAQRAKATRVLDQILLDEFQALSIQFEQATWDTKKNAAGKTQKRPLTIQDVQALQPFHWGYEFDEVMNEGGGFDVILTNPPWETFQPDAKEFFSIYSGNISKKKMSVKEFKVEMNAILKDESIRIKWIEYFSDYAHQRQYFRFAPQYSNQVPIIDGRRHGKDVNLFKLFTEQTVNLLRPQGMAGIVMPSGIYTDLGTKQLREMLFEYTEITGLFGFENRERIFEGVDIRFKFIVLSFVKGGKTSSFPVAFMRHSVDELGGFPNINSLYLDVSLVRKLSPDSISIMEFDTRLDIEIAHKMSEHPLLGEHLPQSWNVEFHREFNMTDDEYLFLATNLANDIPLFEGKMIFQFTHELTTPQYWINEKKGRKAIIGKRGKDQGRVLGYQKYRLAYRSIASNTNERTLISTVIPPCFTGNSINVCESVEPIEQLFCTGVLNSFVVDWLLRKKVTTNVNMFYMYQLPIPRLTEDNLSYEPIVTRAAKLICTTPEFDDLAATVGLGSHAAGVTDPAARAQLRAELDGMIAHIYGLSEEEFRHILSTFPLVDESVKAAALVEYQRYADDPAVVPLIQGGEGATAEFKVGACRDPYTGKRDDKMRNNVVEAVAAFMNASGGTVLVGVYDNGTVEGIDVEYSIANKNKANWDGYELFLSGVLNEKLNIENPFQYYSLSRHTVGGKDIARIQVRPAPKPVYVEKKLYLRASNSTKELQGPDLVAFVGQRRGAV